MKSAIYEGVVDHVRLRPKRHAFSMRIALTYLDLDELDHLFEDDARFAIGRPAMASFDRRDHHSPGARSLADATRDLVENRLGRRPTGAVRLLTHLRYCGYGFNPVSFFYCYGTDEALEAIVSEVNNTPWGERHCYVHDVRAARERGARGAHAPEYDFRFDKAFHVSPFMQLAQRYAWRFTEPGEALSVQMSNHEKADADPRGLFHASMELERLPWTRASRSRLLFRYPLLTAQVVAGIYAHAAILRWKGLRYVPHPNDRVRNDTRHAGVPS